MGGGDRYFSGITGSTVSGGGGVGDDRPDTGEPLFNEERCRLVGNLVQRVTKRLCAQRAIPSTSIYTITTIATTTTTTATQRNQASNVPQGRQGEELIDFFAGGRTRLA